MSSEQLVRVEWPNPRIAVLTLNQPDRLNALSFTMVDELHAVLDSLHRTNECRVVVLTGAGRGFCSGLDLTRIEQSSTAAGTIGPRAGMISQSWIAALPQKIRHMQQPVIAAVNGVAYGGGFALALACDIRVAAPEARFCSQFIKVGLGGCDIGISYTLPRLIGASRAFELLLTGRVVEAEEASNIGLAQLTSPGQSALECALQVAGMICDYSPFGVVMTKEVMWSNLDAPSIEAAVHLENRTQILASTGGEVHAAAAAFRDRRNPGLTHPDPVS